MASSLTPLCFINWRSASASVASRESKYWVTTGESSPPVLPALLGPEGAGVDVAIVEVVDGTLMALALEVEVDVDAAGMVDVADGTLALALKVKADVDVAVVDVADVASVLFEPELYWAVRFSICCTAVG